MAGKVFLVGAGPGDPELMTGKAKRAVGEADAVLHDALIGDEILETLPDLCSGEIIDCGKRKGSHRFTQEEINAELVERARRGEVVVRLKGGDPFVFGRGGEEMEVLEDRGIEVEVVPGITSAIAAPAMAGVPLTRRKVASQATLVTGHEDPSKADSDVDWERLAELDGTLVVLMGITKLDLIAEVLIENGKDPSTPAVTVEKATLPDQKVVRARLEVLPGEVERAEVEPPGTTVIGGVAEQREGGE